MVSHAAASAVSADAVAALAAVVGDRHVLTGEDDRRFYGSDIYRAGEPPRAIVFPGSTEELQQIVSLCAREGMPLTVRGGGASYTDAYTHARPGGITIATDRLDAIEIDEARNTVRVGPGCTWAKLHEALKARGLRTPFWGPFSGLAATVGGSVSQHAISHGGGVSAESVIALEMVTGTGERLDTATPFFRHYGPDLTGLFTGDCGAFGVKAAIILKLVRRSEAFAAVSLGFPDFETMHRAMAAVAREQVDDENFGLDAALQQGQIGAGDGMAAKADIAAKVMKSSGSLRAGVKSLAKMAMAGESVLTAADFAAHYIVEGLDQVSAEAKAAVIRRLGAAHGREIANTVPTVVRAMPFAPLTNVLGPKGERLAPLHALLPHDAVADFHREFGAFIARRRAEMDAHKVFNGTMFMAVGSSAFVYEPAFYWQDARDTVHERMVPRSHLDVVPAYPAAPAAAALVAELKSETIALMAAHGAAHLQIGRTYPYLASRDPATVALLRALKAELDPHNILNPSVLGI